MVRGTGNRRRRGGGIGRHAGRGHLEAPKRIFGAARIEDGALVLDTPGSAVACTGDGFQQSRFGGSLGTVINRHFTLQFDFKADDVDSADTLFDIWHQHVGHFRLRLVEGGRLQMRGRPLIQGKVMQWGLGAHLDRVNVSTCGFIDPQRMDTPRGRYRNLLVIEGVQEPNAPGDS